MDPALLHTHYSYYFLPLGYQMAQLYMQQLV